MKNKLEYKLEYKVKTLVIREIIHLALKKNFMIDLSILMIIKLVTGMMDRR